jgi:hypothetical protein
MLDLTYVSILLIFFKIDVDESLRINYFFFDKKLGTKLVLFQNFKDLFDVVPNLRINLAFF